MEGVVDLEDMLDFQDVVILIGLMGVVVLQAFQAKQRSGIPKRHMIELQLLQFKLFRIP